MFTYKLIGSFNLDHLKSWITENKKRLGSPWKVLGHCIIQFHPDRETPIVYKTLGNIHYDSIDHLEGINPNHFWFIVLTESISMYGRPDTVDAVFPVDTIFNNKEIPYSMCYIKNNMLTFDIERMHWINDETFTTENIYLDKSDRITETYDTITIDFFNKKIISSIIEGKATIF
tara:strand:- start:444 stop:965 length:522 start_codon:yes stop_codon:yes gene_type:complete